MVRTGIFKEPVSGRVAIRRLNLVGDEQADLKVHGGSNKAVYVYPAEYYASWREQFPEMEAPWGMFGENLTIAGLRDDAISIGDELQVGSARLLVTQPRMPCYKLALKFGRDDILKRMFQSGFTGFYCAVLEEGDVAAGDPVTALRSNERAVRVLDIVRLEGPDYYDMDLLRRAVELDALPQSWREDLAKRLAQFS